MVNEENLAHHFNILGCTIENKEAVRKCLDLCDLYQLNEETLAEEWVGYAVVNTQVAESASPSLKSLAEFENAVLKKRRRTGTVEDGVQGEMGRVGATSSKLQLDEEEILGMYGYKSAAPSIKRLRSPENAAATSPESKVRAVESSYSPASYATKTDLPKREDLTVITGRVVHQFGRPLDSWKNTNRALISISKDVQKIQTGQRYMFDILSRRLEIMDNYCYEMAQRILRLGEGNDKEMLTTANVIEMIQEPFRTFGRLKYTNGGDRFSGGSFLLENSYIEEGEEGEAPQKRGSGVSISLDLSKLKGFSIFPGEIVVVEGSNPGHDILHVTEIRSRVGLKAPPQPHITQAIEIVIACGPFTKQDHLDFQPLMRLLQSIAEDEPNLVVLVGPFVPHDNEDIRKAVVIDTYQEIFDNLVEKITHYVRGTCTQVVLVASCEDAHHDNVYPTPEYTISSSLRQPNIHTVSDPCMINAGGLRIGATSVDILKHMAGKEVHQNMTGSDRVVRLAEHILHQACFYPLYPPAKQVNIDMELWERYAIMDHQPHVLLLPSSLKHFCKWSDNTFIINPGNLSKNLYARLMINPSAGDSWSSDCIDCEILKI